MKKHNAYSEFLERKAVTDPMTGLTDIPELNREMFGHQSDITRWALRRGRDGAHGAMKSIDLRRRRFDGEV